MSTIREIARELNLSHTTVSRVLNTRNEQAIPPPTRERIWAAARRMGYHPHAAARALATGRTNLVALLMRHLYTSFHAQVVHEVEQMLRRSGYQMLVTTVDWDSGSSEGDRTLMHAPWQVDGYLAFDSADCVSDLLAPPRDSGRRAAPLVAMGGHNLGDAPDQVAFDLAAGTDAAMAHLIGLGRTRIAHVTEEAVGVRRGRYLHALQTAGLPAEIIASPSQDREDVREAVYRRFRTGGERPDALFCFNDEVAIGAYRALRQLRLRIPEDVALVGFDNILDAAYLDIPLTTVALPIRDLCHQAWSVLQRRLADPEAEPSRLLLRPTLVVRESTRGIAVTDGETESQ